MKFIPIEEQLLRICDMVASRSSCRRKFGCIIMSGETIISSGYNETPGYVDSCYHGGCKRCGDKTIESGKDLDRCICVHAEENAILHAAKKGISIEGCTLITQLLPCPMCTKSIINAGINAIICREGKYPGHTLSKEMLDKNFIKITWMPTFDEAEFSTAHAGVRVR